MDNYIYDDNSGVILVDTSKIKEQVQQEFKNALGDNISLDDNSAQGRLIDAETTARVNVLNNNARMANLFNFKLAYGIFLDSLGATFLKYRNGATQTIVPNTSLTGIAGTIITAGSRVANDKGIIFYLENETTIGSDGTATANFVCEEFGAVPCPVGTLTKIIDGTFGWETINNTEAGIVGREKQSDASFKRDILNGGLFSGKSLFEDYKSAIYQVDGVSSCYVKDNYDKYDIVYDGVNIKANSVFICVLGGNDEEIAKAILGIKSGGCGYTGNINENIIDETFNASYLVSFQRPTIISIYFEINIKNINNTSTNLVEEIKNILISYANGNLDNFGGLGIGEDVNVFDISAVIGANIQGIAIQSLLIGTTAGSLSTNTININISQIASVVAENITININ